MPKINEATDTDLKIIEELKKLGWKIGDTLLYQQEYLLTPEQQKLFEGRKSIRPDITLSEVQLHETVKVLTRHALHSPQVLWLLLGEPCGS